MSRRFLGILGAAATLALGGCSEATSPADLSDEQIATDVATTAGAAIALEVETMIGNESGGGFGPAPSAAGSRVSVTRTRTCYDEAGAVQDACDPATTASVVVHVAVHDTLVRDNFTAYIHRVRDDSVSGLLGTETSRTHDGVGTSNDTTIFTGDRGTRTARESAIDSVVAVRFDLPRSTHPWPTSGQIIRNVSGSVLFEGNDGQTFSRTYSRRVVVTFPADAQGNVAIQVNDRTCTLNLVTHRVVNCQ